MALRAPSRGPRVNNGVANAVVRFARGRAAGRVGRLRWRRRGMGYPGREQRLGTRSSREYAQNTFSKNHCLSR